MNFLIRHAESVAIALAALRRPQLLNRWRRWDHGRLYSGFEGMGLMVVILLTYFWLRRGQLATCTLNAFRIAFLFAIGESISPRLAVGAFHTQAGWISVMLVALVTIAWMEKSPWLHAGPFPLPFVALLLSRLVTSAFTVDFDFLYPARVALVSLILFKCWPQARLGLPKVYAWLAGSLAGLAYACA